jgi:hypothetical protein
MRPDAAQADRNAAVRKAARVWNKAGVIDDAALAKIEAAHPDDRVRVGPVFRVLLFIFTLVGINAGFGFVAMLTGGAEAVWPVLLFGGGVALVLLTEVQTGALRRAQGGTEAATSFAALGFLIGGVAWTVTEMGLSSSSAIWPVLLVSVLLCAAAVWRWGYPAYAVFTMAALLLLFAQLPWGRLLWIAVPLAAAPLLLRLGDSAKLPPSLRASATAALVTALAGLYFAVNLQSFDLRGVELLGAPSLILQSGPRPPALRVASAIATALLPVVLLALGIRTRRRPLLLLGIVTAAASILTLHAYVDLGPPWLLLIVWGAIATGTALALRRFLDFGPDHERAGFTAEPLFDNLERQGVLEAGAALVTFTPEARAHQEPGFAGGGGEFGGGGSSESF